MDGSSQEVATAGPYRVLARKYRPQSFADLFGQEPMVRTLTNAFRSGRIAQAYMLTGVRGVGKTTTARILARALNYSLPGRIDRPTIDMEELGEHCAAVMEGRHIDVIEMDAASHTGIDDIREIIEASRYKPAVARYKVYIIDEVHMLSKQAFNGLLKTLEEPPEHVKFIFATTEVRKVPVTVLSRCQRFDLRRIEAGRLVELMQGIAAKEGVAIDDEALVMIARAAEGSARDSLSLLDQAIAHASGGVEAEAVRAMLGLADRALVIDLFGDLMSGNIAAALARIKDLYAVGADPAVVLEDLAAFTHIVTRLKLAPSAVEDDALTEEEKTKGADFAAKLSLRASARAW
ncbi:MAG: DNA polymerase III subunit gamma/tau, partial [Bauldia sp.]